MSAEEHRRGAPAVLGFGLVTVSDSRTPEQDLSGLTLRRLVESAGHHVVEAELVPDDVAAIRRILRRLLELEGVDVVVLTGGTGLAPRDLTVEAVTPLLDRQLEGFGELFRMLSYEQVGAAAMLSRAGAGMVGRRAVFYLPGSPRAAALAMERLILPEAGHLVGLLRRH